MKDNSLKKNLKQLTHRFNTIFTCLIWKMLNPSFSLCCLNYNFLLVDKIVSNFFLKKLELQDFSHFITELCVFLISHNLTFHNLLLL